MHSQPTPAHPSYRLMSALRMLHCVDDEAESKAPPSMENAFERWRKVLYGQEEQISAAHEQAWRHTLSDICGQVEARAQAGLESIRDTLREARAEVSWAGWMQMNVETLWREELEVARAVAESVKAGVEF